jgi:ribonuclease VapC
MLGDAAIEIVPVTIDQARLAADAYERYGRGRQGAALNFGDCFAYALAKSRGEPLLFKGTDFGLTDIGHA